MTPPPPSKTRAILVGLEEYEGNGLQALKLSGARGTISVIHSWLLALGVPESRIDVWITGATNSDGETAFANCQSFERTRFINFLQDVVAADETGGTLLIYWLGHGFLTGSSHSHHLLLPEATIAQPRSIEVTALSALLKGENFSQFTHQILIFDTCRQAADFGRGGAAAPEPLIPRPIDWIKQVRQCRIYACLEGQTARIQAKAGTVLSRTLIDAVGEGGLAQWPDFPTLLANVGRSTFDQPTVRDRMYAYATNWNGEVSDIWQADSAGGSSYQTPAIKLDLASLQRQLQSALEEADGQAGTEGAALRIVDNKYIEGIYVGRDDCARLFDQFSTDTDRVFAIVGDAGMGKSNTLLNLAKHKSHSDLVIVFSSGDILNGIEESLVEHLGLSFADRGVRAVLEDVDKLVRSSNRSFYIFIDGLNEVPISRREVRLALNHFVERFCRRSQWRLVVSCRTSDWDFWLRNDSNMLGSLGKSVFRRASGPLSCSVELQRYTKTEFAAAWGKYREYFGLVDSMSERMKELCSEPFLLRIVAESFRDGRPIPNDLSSDEIFERFLTERYPVGADVQRARLLLHRIAAKMIHDCRPFVDATVGLTDDHRLLDRLVSDNILRIRDSTVYFQYERYLEYTCAKYLLSAKLSHSSHTEIVQRLRELAESRFINAPGIIEVVLVSLESDPPLVQLIFKELAGSPSNIGAALCAAIRRTPAVARGVLEYLHPIATSQNYILRQYFAHSIAAMPVSLALEILHRLSSISRERWEEQETAALIASKLPLATGYSNAVLTELWRLADSFHWRVRRAAGYALRHIADQADDSGREVVRASIPAPASSRQAHAVLILLTFDRFRDIPGLVQIIPDSLNSDISQFDWLAANYFDKLSTTIHSQLFQILSNSPREWVRGRLAQTILNAPSTRFYEGGNHHSWIGTLSRDSSPSVRLKIARALRSHSSTPWAKSILTEYLSDDWTVSSAATFSLYGETRSSASLPDSGESSGHLDQLTLLRERVAHGDVAPDFGEFRPLEDYLSNRGEFSAIPDPNMRIVDALHSIIAENFSAARSLLDFEEFLRTISCDLDETMRWALVLFVADFSRDSIDAELRYRLLLSCSKDEHFWIRREVAIALPRVHAEGLIDQLTAMSLLMEMRALEANYADSVYNEVQHFLDIALFHLSDPRMVDEGSHVN